MAEHKTNVETAHDETYSPAGSITKKDLTDPMSKQALAEFEERQHAMTVKEAVRENWKPFLWCEYIHKCFPATC